MRVLMMTQALDPADPVLGFTAGWVNALARRVDHVDVLCLKTSAPAPPPNVAIWPIAKRNEATRIRRLIEFERATARLVPQADVVFSHMIPRYACWAGPIATAGRRPIVLWYVHKRDSLELRIATAFCRFVATAVAATFPFATPKLRVLGHGVDDRFFTPHPAAAPASPLLVFVGRLAPIKGQATLIRALSRLDPKHHDARAVFVGAGDAGAYDQSLRDLSSGLGLGSRVSFVGPQEPRAVRDWYRCATIAVNLSPEGLFDKAALESMMCGTPTIVASPSFDELLGADGSWLRVTPPGDADALGRVIGRLLAMSEAARRELAEQIRQRTVAAHALEPMMDRLVQLMGMASHG